MKQFLNLHDFSPAAKRRLPRSIHEFIEGGAEDGRSVQGNRSVFDAMKFQPRVLVDTSARSAVASCLGERFSAPFGIAPMGAAGVAAFWGDLVLARAAAKSQIPFVLSGSSLVAMERVIAENPRAWFQIYASTAQTENDALLARAAASGFATLVVTVDVPVAGNRERDIRNGYASPLKPNARLALDCLLHPRWLVGTLMRTLATEGLPHFENFGTGRAPMISRQATRSHRRDNLSWATLERMRAQWKGRLIIKGVLCAEDAEKARQIGVDAVIVSNHGGRQLDGAIEPLAVLPAISVCAGRMEVLCDSGIRRGTDVLKALAAGASFTFIGRPFLQAAAVGGEAGVLHAIDLMKAEILRSMALLGCADFSDLPARVVLPASGTAALRSSD